LVGYKIVVSINVVLKYYIKFLVNEMLT